jgi:HEAT repeat protein
MRSGNNQDGGGKENDAKSLTVGTPLPYPADVQKAIEALRQYQAGSDRGALVCLEDWVASSALNDKSRDQAEKLLLESLALELPVPAKEFLCGQLVLVGSSTAVPALAKLLEDPSLAMGACSTLFAIPGEEALAAMRAKVSKMQGAPKAIVIQTLGLRRDARSAAALERILRTKDTLSAGAAANALGWLGTPRAASALASILRDGPAELMDVIADACLRCADHLKGTGHEPEASRLWRSLASCGRVNSAHQALGEQLAKQSRVK